MKILSLHIDGFGKFHDRDISFEDGLNVVYGKNEDVYKRQLFTWISPSTIRTWHRSTIFPTDATLSGLLQSGDDIFGEHSDMPYPCAMEIPRRLKLAASSGAR